MAAIAAPSHIAAPLLGPLHGSVARSDAHNHNGFVVHPDAVAHNHLGAAANYGIGATTYVPSLATTLDVCSSRAHLQPNPSPHAIGIHKILSSISKQ
ncbi:unnamed protein product [Prunus brigantina]